MIHTSICIGGNFELLVLEWVPIFRAQVYEWGGFWKCQAAHPYQNDPLVTIEVTSDALSHFDAIYRLNKNKNFRHFGERLCRIGGIQLSKSNAHILAIRYSFN